MSEFFRFPHTPHLAWLGIGSPRDDKVLPASEVKSLLAGEVVVEEKLDGANLGFSVDPQGRVRAQNRGQYLNPPYTGQFSRLSGWLGEHDIVLRELLPRNLILFGEWCAARHSLDYAALPDWFLGFDVYDCAEARFWSTERRDALLRQARLTTVPEVFRGVTNLPRLEKMVRQETSAFHHGPVEGVVVRKENTLWLEARAKLVHPNFIQSIGEHWTRRRLEWNTRA